MSALAAKLLALPHLFITYTSAATSLAFSRRHRSPLVCHFPCSPISYQSFQALDIYCPGPFADGLRDEKRAIFTQASRLLSSFAPKHLSYKTLPQSSASFDFTCPMVAQLFINSSLFESNLKTTRLSRVSDSAPVPVVFISSLL
jgi:hypothetical protein